MNNYMGTSDKLNVTAGGTLTSGTPVHVKAGFVAVPESSVASGESVSVVTRGCVRLSKVSGAIASTIHGAAEAISVGDVVYWDAANSKATIKAVGPAIGRCYAAAASGATTADVAMEPAAFPSSLWVNAVLDYSLNSATGTHALPGAKIPSGYTPIRVIRHVLTTFTSASSDAATIAFGVETQDTDAFLAAVAISDGSNPHDAGLQEADIAAPLVTTAERSITAVIGVTALTAGKAIIMVECVRTGVTA